jgi:hypothetical protein
MATAKSPTAAKSKALSQTEKWLQDRVNKAQANLTTDTSNVIKLSRQGFKYQDMDSMDFHAIVLGSVFENVYYDRPYDQEAGYVDPLCFAVNEIAGNMAPPAAHTQAQSKTCDVCEWNQPGSKEGASPFARACRNGRRVAVVAVPDPDDLSRVDTSEVAVLRIAPTSLTPYAQFETEVYRRRGIDPIQVIAHFQIDESVPYGRIKKPEIVGRYDSDAPELCEELKLLAMQQAFSILEDVGYSLTPTPYVAPQKVAKRRTRI